MSDGQRFQLPPGRLRNERRRYEARSTRWSEDVAAFDAMCAARPLKPPPLPTALRAESAGAVAARRYERTSLQGATYYRPVRTQELPPPAATKRAQREARRTQRREPALRRRDYV
jgi:hypothetical protein